MSLQIETGHPVQGNVKRLTERMIRFVTDDGRAMFEVIACPNGRSIEVRGVGSTKVGGVIYTESLDVRPNVSNSITVMVRPYEGVHT
jgi:hypothetical protein